MSSWSHLCKLIQQSNLIPLFISSTDLHFLTPLVTALSACLSVDDGLNPLYLARNSSYPFCGRTALDHFDAESRPLKFIWKLVDNEVLRSSKEFMDIVC